MSLRARFALFTALLVLAVASLVAITGYLAMRSSLLDRASGAAQTQARQLAGLVDSASAGGVDSQGNRVDISDPGLTHELAAPGTFIEVRRPNGGLIQATHILDVLPPALSPAFLAGCISNGRAQQTSSKPAFALACQRVGPRSSAVGTISVGAPLTGTLQSLRTLRTALILGVLSGASIAAALALFLARQATRPIARIATTAETIRSGDLSRRIGYHRNDELGALAGVLDSCFAELEQALERQRRFAADASHELRTPIAAIRANLELLRGWAADEPTARAKALASLDQASGRAARLINDLLYLATVEREPPQAHTHVRLDQLVVGVVREASQLRPEVRIEITRLDELEVKGDAHRLQQLLLNVLDNALRVTPPHRTVCLLLTHEESQAKISIIDQGPGMKPDQLPHIFDRLYTRPVGTDGEHNGTGLGLAIAHAIARAHDGELTAVNNPEGGATFTVTLATVAPDPREARSRTRARTHSQHAINADTSYRPRDVR